MCPPLGTGIFDNRQAAKHEANGKQRFKAQLDMRIGKIKTVHHITGKRSFIMIL